MGFIYAGSKQDREYRMKIVDVKLDTVCGYTSKLPVFEEPEIAFAGRSNVGKSSLINVLMKRKRLARVGETPGKTRTINFYHVKAQVPDPEKKASMDAETEAEGGQALSQAAPASSAGKKLRWKNDPEKAGRGKKAGAGLKAKSQLKEKVPQIPMVDKGFYLVDLPGYGYASVPESEKAKWGAMIENYLNSSQGLGQVFLLVDIRHDPGANDLQMYEWIRSSGYQPVIIATKADKLSKGQVPARLSAILAGFGAPEGTEIIAFSAQTGQGASQVYGIIDKSV